jgi:hypothetical protein
MIKSFKMEIFWLFQGELEECEDISYLGITLNNNGSFIKAKNKLVQQAQKTLYSVYRKVQNVCTPVDLQIVWQHSVAYSYIFLHNSYLLSCIF